MKIIKANETHIPEILEIYVKARKWQSNTMGRGISVARDRGKGYCSRSLLCLHGK